MYIMVCEAHPEVLARQNWGFRGMPLKKVFLRNLMKILVSVGAIMTSATTEG